MATFLIPWFLASLLPRSLSPSFLDSLIHGLIEFETALILWTACFLKRLISCFCASFISATLWFIDTLIIDPLICWPHESFNLNRTPRKRAEPRNTSPLPAKRINLSGCVVNLMNLCKSIAVHFHFAHLCLFSWDPWVNWVRMHNPWALRPQKQSLAGTFGDVFWDPIHARIPEGQQAKSLCDPHSKTNAIRCLHAFHRGGTV